MSSPDAGLHGFYARASQNAGMKAVLGTKDTAGSPARLYPGWPSDTLTRSDFPRATYFLVRAVIRRPGVLMVEVQCDGWFWMDDAATAADTHSAKMQTWTNVMLSAFDEQHWYYNGTRLYSTVMRGTPRDYPSAPETAARRLIRLRIEVSPGPAI